MGNDSIPTTVEGSAFYQSLITTIYPKNQSDRTCFRRIACFLERQIAAGVLNDRIYHSVLNLASEAKLPGSKNPAAVFTAAFKREFNYEPASNYHSNQT
jgi:hypothetical protein